MDTFSQSGKQSQISLLWCVPHHTPPNDMPVFKLAQVDSCLKAIPPLLQGGTCGPGKGGGNGGRWRGEGEWLKRWDDSEARGWSHLHASRLGPSLSAAPLSALSFLYFTHSTYPPPPRNGPHGFSHHIANMQSFLWFKKKSNNLKNMQIDWV